MPPINSQRGEVRAGRLVAMSGGPGTAPGRATTVIPATPPVTSRMLCPNRTRSPGAKVPG